MDKDAGERKTIVIDDIGSGFTIVSNVMARDSRFNENGVAGLRAFQLIVYAKTHREDWQLYRKKIAKDLGIDLKALDRAIAVAKKLGYLEVEVEYETRDTGVKSPYNVWRILNPFAQGRESGPPFSVSENTPFSVSEQHKNTNVRRNTIQATSEKEPRDDASIATLVEANSFSEAIKLVRKARANKALTLAESNALLRNKLITLLDEGEGQAPSPPLNPLLASPRNFLKWPRFAWVLSELPNRARQQDSTKLLDLYKALAEDADGTVMAETGSEVIKLRGSYKRILEKYPFEQALMALFHSLQNEDYSYLVSGPYSLIKLVEKFSKKYTEVEKQRAADKRREELRNKEEKREPVELLEEPDEDVLWALGGKE